MILIVEDQPITARVIESSLLRAGHPCVIAGDGRDAIEILKQRNDVSLVITDVEMPTMDGFAMITQIRANQAWKSLPVVVVSAHNDLETVKRAGSLGVRQFVLKPVVPERLLQTITPFV
jgi:two-component system, chemotaxis family, chemotaxis protein CheY